MTVIINIGIMEEYYLKFNIYCMVKIFWTTCNFIDNGINYHELEYNSIIYLVFILRFILTVHFSYILSIFVICILRHTFEKYLL